jgi:hypothetical protein
MKPIRISRTACAVAALATVISGMSLFAFNVMRSTNRRPDLQLPQAYELALGALGSETNSFYCLRADARSMTESPGSAEWRPGAVEWHFEFYATNGQFRELIVPSDGKIIKRDRPRDGY